MVLEIMRRYMCDENSTGLSQNLSSTSVFLIPGLCFSITSFLYVYITWCRLHQVASIPSFLYILPGVVCYFAFLMGFSIFAGSIFFFPLFLEL